MYKRRAFFSLVSLFLLLASLKEPVIKAFHPLYVSVVQFDYSGSDKFATVLCKIFPDDLEAALQKKYNRQVNIFNKANQASVSEETLDYLNDHLQIKINGQPVIPAYMNFKIEDKAISINFKISRLDAVRRVEINDSIFYEVYDTQMQIVYITVDGNRKSRQLRNPTSMVAFDF